MFSKDPLVKCEYLHDSTMPSIEIKQNQVGWMSETKLPQVWQIRLTEYLIWHLQRFVIVPDIKD